MCNIIRAGLFCLVIEFNDDDIDDTFQDLYHFQFTNRIIFQKQEMKITLLVVLKPLFHFNDVL